MSKIKILNVIDLVIKLNSLSSGNLKRYLEGILNLNILDVPFFFNKNLLFVDYSNDIRFIATQDWLHFEQIMLKKMLSISIVKVRHAGKVITKHIHIKFSDNNFFTMDLPSFNILLQAEYMEKKE